MIHLLLSLIVSVAFARANELKRTEDLPAVPANFPNEGATGLAIIGPAGTGKNAQELVKIAGCPYKGNEGKARPPGLIEFAYTGDGSRYPSNDCNPTVIMAEPLSTLINKSFKGCLKYADPSISETDDVKIYFDGVAGDERHSAAGYSLHNHHRAIDIPMIQVGNKTFDWEDKNNDNFFKLFRDCWCIKAQDASSDGKLGIHKDGGQCGTIGKENDKHKHHLHLSMPYSETVAGNLGVLNASFQLLFGEQAHAGAEFSETDEARPNPTVELPILETQKGYKVTAGRVNVKVRDQRGEPINKDKFISVELTCTNTGKTVSLTKQELNGCQYDLVTYDKKNETLVVHYRRAKLLDDGKVSCSKQERAPLSVSCK